MSVRYRVELSQIERAELKALLSGDKHAPRKLKRAQILLAAAGGDEKIARSVGVSSSTCTRTTCRFVRGSLERAPSDELRPRGPSAHPSQGRLRSASCAARARKIYAPKRECFAKFTFGNRQIRCCPLPRQMDVYDGKGPRKGGASLCRYFQRVISYCPQHQEHFHPWSRLDPKCKRSPGGIPETFLEITRSR
ncbi:hypothetical protein ACVIWU_006511 [Bradyrhizobium sp. USDA 4509]